MSWLRRGLQGWSDGTAAALLVLAAAAPFGCAQQAASVSGFRAVSLAEYRQHLEALDGVVAGCVAQIQSKTPPPANGDACDPGRVGPDDRVQGWAGAGAEPREVRYDWLRAVLRRASKNDSGAAAAALGAQAKAKNEPPDAHALLNDARERLRMDEAQAGSSVAEHPVYTAQRRSLDAILAQPQYRSATKTTLRDRIVEWIENQLDHLLTRLAGFGARAPWIARLLELLLLAGALTALAWLLVRLERNARVRLVPSIEIAPGAPPAREWQLRLKDAETAAAAGAWREAIHSVYWASIARLESNATSGRAWPADRARTPREYLGLLGSSDPRKTALAALTRSFERTWYAGRQAEAADFNTALHWAAELGVKAR